jgi:hypothetical protein
LHFEPRLPTIEFSIMYKALSIKYEKLKKFLIILFVLLNTCYILHAATLVNAQTMSNQDYIIRNGNLNPVSDSASVTQPNPPADAKPTVSEGVNFKAIMGFKDFLSRPPFTVSLSSDIVDFGIISPTDPIIRTMDLSVNSSAVYGYSVIAFENENLTAVLPTDKAIIPDTTCDNGGCDTQTTAQWSNALTYGFGYHCDNLIGTDCDVEFANPNSYRHFSNTSSNDDPQTVMSGVGSDNKQVRMFYKVNISGNQAQGNYGNIITYIGIPNF